MSAINSFAKSGFWDYRNTIVPIAVATPLAIEGAILAKNIYQKPEYIKDKFTEWKDRFIKSFTPQAGETRAESIQRIAKNVFIALAALSLMASAAYLSVFLLPSALAISVAISSVFLIGKLFLNAKEYKKQIVDAFTAKPEEDPAVARKRILKNIIKTALVSAVAIAAIVIGATILIPLFTNGFSWSIALPFQTKGVVFAEYASLGLVHGGLAYSKFRKGDIAGGLFHLFGAALSFIFPAFYWNNDMRLHHSFYGLLMMALPFRATKFLGSMIVFDSSLYMLEPVRGYATAQDFVQYDFINSVADNFPLFCNTYAASLIAQNINDNWAKDEIKPEKEVPQVLNLE